MTNLESKVQYGFGDKVNWAGVDFMILQQLTENGDVYATPFIGGKIVMPAKVYMINVDDQPSLPEQESNIILPGER